MKRIISAAAFGLLLGAAVGAHAQDRPEPVPPVQPLSDRQTTATLEASTEPDVLLDVPKLSIEEVTIEVENLEAHLNVEAELANLLHLNAGADLSVDGVKIGIKGVEAQVLLKVRLDNVAAIIDRTLTTIDRNPEILEGLLSTVENTVNTVGDVANTTLQPGGVVDNTVGTLGEVAGRAIPPRQ